MCRKIDCATKFKQIINKFFNLQEIHFYSCYTLLFQATIPGIFCGPLTAELVTQSNGRWSPVFVQAAFMNFVGCIVYLSQSAASQVL